MTGHQGDEKCSQVETKLTASTVKQKLDGGLAGQTGQATMGLEYILIDWIPMSYVLHTLTVRFETRGL